MTMHMHQVGRAGAKSAPSSARSVIRPEHELISSPRIGTSASSIQQQLVKTPSYTVWRMLGVIQEMRLSVLLVHRPWPRFSLFTRPYKCCAVCSSSRNLSWSNSAAIPLTWINAGGWPPPRLLTELFKISLFAAGWTQPGIIKGVNVMRLWLIPMIYVGASVLFGLTVPLWEQTYLPEQNFGLSVSSAQAYLSATASGMMALMGIVFALAFVMVQFSAIAYSPRLVLWFARDRLLFHSLGVFAATFLYALFALAWVGRGGSGAVPLFSSMLVATLLIVSMLLFSLLVQRLSDLQITNVLRLIGDRGREVIHDMFSPFEATSSSAAHGGTSQEGLGEDVRCIAIGRAGWSIACGTCGAAAKWPREAELRVIPRLVRSRGLRTFAVLPTSTSR